MRKVGENEANDKNKDFQRKKQLNRSVFLVKNMIILSRRMSCRFI
ncbi:hypothetical protein [Lutispora thermophila]|uniref:Uncharacterized protein n=1 Tax=Lutispora thermophila DSM 19022 TaxID=1122184 RepID=A0A1M6ATY0_9FIRM|nr:hypothetical protein [Lutispora thermophila]SHI39984.1 hypothetical protein SAMN02745176_00115 [Lutispora thermophila DSM 19022]